MKVNFCTVIRDGKEPTIFGLCLLLVLWFSLGSECFKKNSGSCSVLSSVNIGFGFFIDRIGKMFPWWSSVTDYL